MVSAAVPVRRERKQTFELAPKNASQRWQPEVPEGLGKHALLFRSLLGSDSSSGPACLQHVRNQVCWHVLATPPEQVAAASDDERQRVSALANRILPVSSGAAGLRARRVGTPHVPGASAGPLPWACTARRAITWLDRAGDRYRALESFDVPRLSRGIDARKTARLQAEDGRRTSGCRFDSSGD
jgi:hypothetical protein